MTAAPRRRLADDDGTLQALAEALADAAARRRPIAPLTSRVTGLSVPDAYRIQQINIERALAAGRRLVGRKLGLTSRPMQEMMGVDEPDFGILLDDMILASGARVPPERVLQPRVEAEIGLVLAHELRGPGLDAAGVAAALAGVVPVIEIIDSRIEDWQITLADTIADNASSGLVVAGGPIVPVDGFDLRVLGMALYADDELVATGAGAAALGDPLACVAWLANRLAEFGEVLQAESLILSGALHRAAEVSPGQEIVARFDRIGSVSVGFAR